MPGICCIAQREGFDEHQLLASMANSIKHEEWYLTDRYSGPFFGIARVHLGIFNPEPQPIFNEDKSLLIFMDGKIFDYEGRKKDLERRGHRFAIDNDPEFCLHFYEELGKDFVKQLNGIFTIVIYDIEQQKLLILGDRYGLRPLYYAIDNNRLLVASEAKTILQANGVRELDDEAIADFFSFGKILQDKTFFNNIKVLPPASILEYKDGKLTVVQYWDFDFNAASDIPEEEFAELAVETFKAAVKRRLVDNYRYGVSLSGGLDSRAIVAALGEAAPQVMGLTLGMKDSYEVEIARRVAQKAGMKHVVTEVGPDGFPSYARDVVYLTDGMDTVGVTWLLPTHEEFRKYVDVLFQGLGAPLLRTNFLDVQLINARDEEELVQLLYHRRIIFPEDMRFSLFNKGYQVMARDMPMNSLRKAVRASKGDQPGNKASYFAVQNHMRRYSWMGSGIIAGTKLEPISPYYDNDFVDLVQKVPPQFRVHDHIYHKFFNRLSPELARITYCSTDVRPDAPLALWRIGIYYTEGKERLKKLLWSITGGKIVIRGNHAVPIQEWQLLNEKWRALINDTILAKDALSSRYFNMDYVKWLVENHGSMLSPGQMIRAKGFTCDYSLKLNYLITFELLLRLSTK